MTNRLSRETSPYLLQHAHNPVDWYPWGEEAFDKARREDKPILLSVGYSACHWCHVMAHESFEDPETASLMNRAFVNVKLDREERPDVDAIYMSAVQAMTGQGGWPLTVMMTPDGKPFFGGTYFPPENRFGRPSFKRVILSLEAAWQSRRQEVLESAERLTQWLGEASYLGRLSSLPGAPGELNKAVLGEALTALTNSFDSRYGGFGGAPKFPPHSVMRFLLRQGGKAREMALYTLDQLASGGIYDHLGGGFARYSVDERWLVPHFEKMLYDNAQLIQRYSEAYQLTGKPRYAQVVAETIDWVQREMLDPSGGCYSALDADSEGEEGKFYLWDESEFDALVGEDTRLAKTYYGVSTAGNFEGRNILHTPHSQEAVAERFSLSLAALDTKLARINRTLFTAREQRIRPGLDNKILTSWNGLMLVALADAGRIFKRQDYLDLAIANAEFIRRELYQDGRLLHTFTSGRAKIAGLLEDYAYYGFGLLALYRATLNGQWLMLALELAETIMAHFRDPEGGFFSTADDAKPLLIRPKNYFDSPNPSENAAAAELLLTLARYTGNAEWEALARGAIKPLLEAAGRQPSGFGTLLCVVQELLEPPREIAIVGDRESEDTQALLAVLEAQPLPQVAIALIEGPGDPLVAQFPFLQGKERLGSKATAYVCEGGACRLPVTTPEALSAQLASAWP
ncbi:MAG: thioredoxin domain-containing protein [Truepera sp.]|nr:thioredoxin domain-containing protein [Truepera sp.]